jgi:hypothetical protein
MGMMDIGGITHGDTTNIQFRRNARWAAQGTQKAVAESRKAAKAASA